MPAETVGVVGAGILGLAIARQIQHRRPGTRVVVFEKEDAIGRHQTGHNSGVVHAGIYYKPGSLKAGLCRRGAALLKDFCQEKGIAYDECGKLVVAVSEKERAALRQIEQRAHLNNVPGLRWLSADEIAEIEPFATGVAALHSPRTAITDYVAVSEALVSDIRAAGGELRLNSPVKVIAPDRGGARVVLSSDESESFDHVVMCAGLQSSQLAKRSGDVEEPMILPFRGEYLNLIPERNSLVRGMIYPVPDPRYPFLGVHLTRRVDGSVDVGPNAVFALAREGYERFSFSPRDLVSAMAFPGFWRVARQHWRMGVAEAAGSLSMRVFVNRARAYVPSLELRDVRRGGAGVRAQAVDRSGELVEDFRIHHLGAVTALRNAPSPAATSSLAIAEHVVSRLELSHA